MLLPQREPEPCAGQTMIPSPRQQFVEQRVVQEAGQFLGTLHPEEVHAPYTAREQRVAGEDDPRRAVGVVEQVTHAAGGVAGRADGLHLEPPHLPHLAVFHRLPVAVLHLCVGAPDLRAGARGQFDRADHIVLVAVGLQDVGDAQPLLRRPLDVHLAVAPRVNHERVQPIADEI